MFLLMHRRMIVTAAVAAVLTGTGCGGSSGDAPSSASGKAAVTVAPGDTIVVEMHSDATGNYYKPDHIEAKHGDLVRFVLMTGVHNVNFLPDSNLIKKGLPAPSDMLQLPGQQYDLVVDLESGDYFFQCDPHAALGMVGTLGVSN